MTGYEEILTDPSYAGQIITFTLPAHRQCRHQRGRHRERQHGGAAGRLRRHSAFRHHAAVELPRHPAISTTGSRRRGIIGLCRHRHPRADRADPREGHAERRDRARARRKIRSRRAEEASQGLAGPRRHGPGADGDVGPEIFLGRDAVGLGRGLRPPDQTGFPRGRDRLRHQAQYPAAARRLGLQGDGGAGQDFGRRHHGAQARRRVFVERAGRSGGDRRIRRAGDQEADRLAARRRSGFASGIRCSASRSAARP